MPSKKQKQKTKKPSQNKIDNKQKSQAKNDEPKDELLKNPLGPQNDSKELPDLIPDSELEPIPELSFDNDFQFDATGFQNDSEEEDEGWDFAKYANDKTGDQEEALNFEDLEEEEGQDDENEEFEQFEEEDIDTEEEEDEEEDEGESEEEEEEEEEEGEIPDDGDITQSIGVTEKEKKEEAKLRKAEEEAEQGYDREFFDEAPDLAYDVTFSDLNLSRPLRAAIDKLGYVHPTPIQAHCIPVLLEGRDVCASAMTGSGKSAAFLLPTMERLLYRSRSMPASRVLVLLPTRELAVQCFSMADKLGQLTDIRSALICGGLPRQAQEQALLMKPDIIIGTPGRIIDHLLNSKAFNLVDIEILILDEADRLLDMGFYDQLVEIVKSCPRDRQTMLFSATMTDKVDSLVNLSLKRPVRISIDNREGVAEGLTQDIIKIKQRRDMDREPILMALCTRTFNSNVVIFCNFRRTVDRLDVIFRMHGLKASSLHGLMSQDLRLVSLEKFKKGESDFLIATDVAARGLDIKGVKTVINFEMPDDLPSYIHRVGRTARAGQQGVAVSLCGEEARPILKKVIRNAHKKKSPIRHRDVPKNVVQFWSKKLKKQEGLVKEELEIKKVERKMEENEMYQKKAQNIAKYRDQILSRPERGWFKDRKEEREQRKQMSKERGIKEAKKRAKQMIQNAEKKETEEQRIERLKQEFMKKFKAENEMRKAQKREARRKREMEEFKEATGFDNMKEFFKDVKGKHREDPDRFKRLQKKRRDQKKRQKAKVKRTKQQAREKTEDETLKRGKKRKAGKQGGRAQKCSRASN